MKVTIKGQITIPMPMRKKFGLLPDTEVEFVDRGVDLVIRRKRGGDQRGWALVERMRGKASSPMTTDQLLKITRGARE